MSVSPPQVGEYFLIFSVRITLASNMVTVIMVFDTSVPIPLRSMCATPNIVITSIMACRVYRRTRAGFFREAEISTTTMMFEKKHKPTSTPPIRVDIGLRNDIGHTSTHSSGTALPTEVRMSVEEIQTKDYNSSRSILDIEKGV